MISTDVLGGRPRVLTLWFCSSSLSSLGCSSFFSPTLLGGTEGIDISTGQNGKSWIYYIFHLFIFRRGGKGTMKFQILRGPSTGGKSRPTLCSVSGGDLRQNYPTLKVCSTIVSVELSIFRGGDPCTVCRGCILNKQSRTFYV